MDGTAVSYRERSAVGLYDGVKLSARGMGDVSHLPGGAGQGRAAWRCAVRRRRIPMALPAWRGAAAMQHRRAARSR
jgi:hypothetical protein